MIIIMSSISAISNSVLKRTIPSVSHNFPIITKTPTCNGQNNPMLKSVISPLKCHLSDIRAVLAGRVDPPGIPPEFPGSEPPAEVPPLTTSPDVDPRGAPPEVLRVDPQPLGPDPRPEIEFPKHPGPDILPPDRLPGPEIDPPRTPLPDVPPVRPPGPEIVPPPDIKLPPGSPFGDFGF